MKQTAAREDFLTPLQSVIGVVERRQTMPVLANVLLSARDNRLNITGTDLEVELVATSTVNVQQGGDITVPGRKLLDIFRSLPEQASVTLSTEGERMSIKAGRSRFTLSTLPAAEFPLVEEINAQQTLTCDQYALAVSRSIGNLDRSWIAFTRVHFLALRCHLYAASGCEAICYRKNSSHIEGSRRSYSRCFHCEHSGG